MAVAPLQEQLRAHYSRVQNGRLANMRTQLPVAPKEPRTPSREGSKLRRQLLRLAAILLVSAPAAAAAAQARAADELQQVPQLIQSGKLGEAKKLLSEYLKTHPAHSGALNLLGVVEAQEGNYGGAEASFEKAIVADPRFSGPYLNLGRLYQENPSKDPQAWKKGAATYERLLKFEPGNPEATYQGALLRMQLGDYAASLVHLTHLPRELQERAQALAVRCADHAGLQNRTQAEATEKQLLASPDLVEADVITILPTLARQHQAALAIGILEGWDKRGVASADALHPLAALYTEGGSLDKARAALERVAQLQGVSVPLLMELARVANREKDYQGALGYLAHARDLEPNNAAVHFFFGIVAGETNLGEEAYRSLEKAVSLDANNPYYNYALGATMMNREDVHDAYPYFQKYCALKPQDPRGRLALAAAYFYGHDLDLAQKELHSVAGYKETATGAHYFLGRVANQEGRYAEAVAELQKALEGNPRYADAYAELGIVYLKQKQDPEAEKCLAQALEISPDNIPANFNLMILYQRRGDPRAEARAKRFEELRKLRWERQKEFLRTIQVQP